VKSWYLSFAYNKDPGQADQPSILHINGTVRTEKATMTFSISILHLITFSSLLLLSHQCKDAKELLPTFRPQQNSNQERAARLTSTRQVNSDRIDAQLPSPICDPTIVKDPKRTPATVSLSDLQEPQKNSLSNDIV